MWSRLCRFRLKMGASEEPAPRRLTAHSVLTIVGGVLVVGAVAWVTKHGVRAAVERPIYRQIADGFPSDDALGASDEFWAATHSACLLSAYEDGAPYHVDCDAWATPPPGLDNTTCAKPDTYMVERCAERAWCRRLCGETLRTHEARGRRRTGARARARARASASARGHRGHRPALLPRRRSRCARSSTSPTCRRRAPRSPRGPRATARPRPRPPRPRAGACARTTSTPCRATTLRTATSATPSAASSSTRRSACTTSSPSPRASSTTMAWLVRAARRARALRPPRESHATRACGPPHAAWVAIPLFAHLEELCACASGR